MASPGFNNPVFQPQGQYGTSLQPPAQQPGAFPRQGAGQQAYPGYVDPSQQARMEGAYASPSADSVDTGRMTIEDTVIKTVLLFAAMLVTAVVGWVWTLGGALSPSMATQAPNLAPWIIGALGGFVLAMVNIFKKKPSVPLIFGYALFEGLFVGGISAYFEFIFPGVVFQATLATVAVIAVTLALFANGKIRASKRATKIFMIAMIGYLVFSLLNVILMWTGVADNAFGLRSMEVMGIPLGAIIGVLVVIMAAYSLVLDFDQIQQGVRNGAPRKYAWQGAFGIMVTVVWLYVEILRILAIFQSSD
ncbi:Bax inhibitor-1/YccA family protein [Microbacterium halophytorum]|uniref:Bax inhibitor-1/YccA family protein n=1 Tax=Microbacterium halophytorum TaxID=2067568 RepID=UPI000CFBBB27|nr:Bax inhibitor-1/YccA family protein [Microbacterium halophytorum]